MDEISEIKRSVELTFRSWGTGRTRTDSLSEPEQKKVLKSLLDQFLEATEDEDDLNPDDNSALMTQKLLDQVEAFLVQVAKCYQGYGCPTHTIETNIVKVAKGLGIDAQVLVFPTQIFIEIDNMKTEAGISKRHSQFFRTASGYNFYKLQLVDELVRRISSYAQDAEKAAQTQEIAPVVVDKVFQRARAFSEAVSSGNPDISLSPEEICVEHDGHVADQKVTNSDELGTSATMDGRPWSNGPHRSAEEIIRGEATGDIDCEPMTPKPAFHMLLPHLPRRMSFSHHSKIGGAEKQAITSKLARTILTLACIGPNVYTVHHEDGTELESNPSVTKGRTYRNLFSKLAVEDGVKLIRTIIKQKPLYSMWFKVVMVGVSSFGSCGLFFGGSWLDCVFSFVLGIMIALIELTSIYSPTFSRIYEFIATFAASIVIRAVSAHYKHFCYRAVLLATIVFVLQGATITMAFVDIMTKDLITGSTKVFFGMLISALIGFAMDISTSTYATLTDRDYDSVVEDSVCENPVDVYWYPLLFVIMAVGFDVLLETHRNQLTPMVLITAASYLVYYYLTKEIGNSIPTIMASFTASCLSNLYSRRTGQPAVVYIIPAIFLLVPGSVAASSFYTVLTLDLRGGLNLTFAVVTGALSVAIGIFAASAVLPVPDVEEYFRKTASAYPGPHSKHDSPRTRREKDFNSGLNF